MPIQDKFTIDENLDRMIEENAVKCLMQRFLAAINEDKAPIDLKNPWPWLPAPKEQQP